MGTRDGTEPIERQAPLDPGSLGLCSAIRVARKPNTYLPFWRFTVKLLVSSQKMPTQHKLVDRSLSGGVRVTEERLATRSSTLATSADSGQSEPVSDSFPFSNERFRSLAETVAMTDDWTVCRCQIHRSPNLDGTPVTDLEQKFVGRHPSIRGAAVGKSKFCHATEKTRKRDHLFASLVLRPLPKWSDRVFNHGRYDRDIRRCMSPNKADSMEFGLGYCLMDAINPHLRWPAARILGPTARLGDWIQVLGWAGLKMCPSFEVSKRDDGILHVSFYRSMKDVQVSALFNKLLKEFADDPECRVGLLASAKDCPCTLPCLCSLDRDCLIKRTSPTSTVLRERKVWRKGRVVPASSNIPSVPTSNYYQCLDGIELISSNDGCATIGESSGALAPKKIRLRDHQGNGHASWQKRCIMKKKWLLSFPKRVCNFKTIDGTMRPFKHGVQLYRHFPETLGGAMEEVNCLFGLNWSSINPLDFLASMAWLKTYRTCPKNGFVISFQDGGVSLSTSNASGVEILFNGFEVFHLGERRPQRHSISGRRPLDLQLVNIANGESPLISPRDGDASSHASVSSANLEQVRVKNQDFINRCLNPMKADDMDESECRRRLWIPTTIEPWQLGPTFVFGIALAFKQRYGCPTKELFIVNIRRQQNTITVERRLPSEEGDVGLYFHIDNQFWYHCGKEGKRRSLSGSRPINLNLPSIVEGRTERGLTPGTMDILNDMKSFGDMMDNLVTTVNEDAEFATRLAQRSTVKMNWWRLIARVFLRKAQDCNRNCSKQAILLANLNVPCTQPWYDKQLIGFRVCAGVGGHKIYSRGMDFDREDPHDPALRITVRTDKRFWSGGNLMFTPKGLAKVFFRKGNQEKWRYAIAKGIGLSLDAAYKFFSEMIDFPEMPDVKPESLDSDYKKLIRKELVVEKPVFVEVPIIQTPVIAKGKDSAPVLIPPPAPPAAPGLPEGSRAAPVKIVNGDSYLLTEGAEGKARRAEFRHHFQGDWWQRVSSDALKAMNRDLINENEPSRSFSIEKLKVDPKDSFDLYKHVVPFSPPVPGNSSLFDELKSKARSKVRFKDPRISIEADRGVVKGRVLYGDSHEEARDSTKADIEENPGPVDTAWPPTLPSTANRKDYLAKAWLGDALFSLNVKLTLFARTGALDDLGFKSLTEGVAMAKFMKRLYAGVRTLDEFSTHVIATKFEYLYFSRLAFREFVHREMDMLSTATIIDSLPDDELIPESTHCWRLLFKQPMSMSYPFENNGQLTTSQVKLLAKNEESSGNRCRMSRLQSDVHITPRGNKFPWEIIRSLKNTDMIGASHSRSFSEPADLTVTHPDDKLTIQYPSPRELWRTGRDRRVSLASTFMTTRQKPVFTEEGSPLDEQFVKTSATPVDGPPPWQDQFRLPRFSTDADIELNPGPSTERGRSTTPRGSGNTGPARSKSRTRSAIDTMKGAIGMHVDSELDKASSMMGIELGFALSFHTPSPGSWLGRSYDKHYIIGHLPSDREWRLYEPCFSDRASGNVNACQRSLDSLFFAKNHFSLSSVGEVVRLMNKFCQKTMLNEGFDYRSLSAMAHLVKTQYSCPIDGAGYCIELNSNSRAFILHYTDSPSHDLKDKLVWTINDSNIFHGGNDQPTRWNNWKERAWNEAGVATNGFEKEYHRCYDSLMCDPTGQFGSKNCHCRFWHYVYLRLYYVIYSIKIAIVDNLWPEFDVDYPDRHPDSCNGESLLIGEYGTKGDITPIKYFVNVARHYGVPTKEKVFNHMDNDDLERLRRGDFIHFAPKQLHMVAAGHEEYAKVFLPHVKVAPHIGESYCLNPPSTFVRDTKFVDDWTKVSLLNLLPAVFATITTAVVDHTWRIGALKGCQLPRSVTGRRLLWCSENKRKHLVGWTSGSADESVIPLAIRKEHPRIPAGDHTKIFADYETIYCHGGAGTVQTAIACGARVVVCDPTLDRDYHTLPTQADFRQPSIAPFMGWLVWSGFKTTAPYWVKALWLVGYFWSVKYQIVYRTVYSIAKAIVIVNYLKDHWGLILLLFFAVPTLCWKILFRVSPIRRTVRTVIWGLWNFPLFCLMESKFSFVVTLWSLQKLLRNVLNDWANAADTKTELIYEPVQRQGLKFPFPFGHWAVRDLETRNVYEGCFTTSSQTLGSPFKFRKLQRDLKPGAKIFPAPFSPYRLEKMVVDRSEPKPYGPIHNCSTFIAELIAHRSFVWSVFCFTVCGFIYCALSPPDQLRWVMKKLFPHVKLTENPLYLKLGFAAGIENIPFELEDIADDPTEKFLEGEGIRPGIDWSHPDSFDSLVNEIAVIHAEVIGTGVQTLTEEDVQEASERTLIREIEKITIPEDKLLEYGPLPPYVKKTWAQVVDNLHHAISFISQNRFVESLVIWLKSITANVFEFIFPILEALSYLLSLALEQSGDMFYKLFVNGCHLIDYCWGLEASKRIKTAWGLTGLYRTGMLGAKARIAANITYNEFVGRSEFDKDYASFLSEIRPAAQKAGIPTRGKIGGPQRRPVKLGVPIMSEQEAKLLGFKKGEYATSDEYQKRIDSYLAQGTTQGADGVFLAEKRPELIAKSQHRYEPKYPTLTSDDRAFAKEIAQALFDRYPEVFKDADITDPRSTERYIKPKYSPGTPFIRPGGFQSRQAMFDAGYNKIMRERALEKMKTGDYSCQFYHAFVKSQVVDVKKCLGVEEGGSNKDVRTVVSQDLFSYFIDQTVQIERNKRINWDTYGAGIGMPLNQSMEKIYSRMADLQRTRGGRYIILDASAFDSICKPFLFEVGAYLWDMGFENHPSGNGKNISSIVRASYDARQSAWIIGITEKEHNNLCIAIPDKETRKKVEARSIDHLVPLAELIDYTKFNKMTLDEKRIYVSKLELPPNKTILTWDPSLRPGKANWMGCYEFGSTKDVANKFFKYQTFTYDHGDLDGLLEDVRRVSCSNYRLLSNVHAKNRGGSTGGSDTSSVNTHAFKAGVIAAWCKTTGRRPKEFFEYNDIANTSDDTIWQSGGTHGLNTVQDLEKFKVHCAEYGINLEMDTTKSITQVEYLSKFVRVPTPQDSAELKAWRTIKMRAINNANKQRGLKPAKSMSELNNPRFVVVQNPTAILHRRTAFRYYQSSHSKWKYTSVERGSGHAYNTAFLPDLYEQFALEWCDDVNSLLEMHKIHRKYAVKNGKFGLQEATQVDPRAGQQVLSPRQKAFLAWLKGNMLPTYYKVIDVHMDVKKIDPEKHAKFLRKLEKGWRGYNEIAREGVDWLFQVTNSIPDEWSKKFQPGIEMLYTEYPFYTRNKIVEKFVYLKLLEESPSQEISFGDFSTRLQESPYAGGCDPYHFWEQLQDPSFRQSLEAEETRKIQGLVFLISAMYMLTSAAEWTVMSFPLLGIAYKLFLWSFIGLNKVYGVLNTAYWHSTGKSSREISRIMPKDPYLISKQFCMFCVDLLPDALGLLMFGPTVLLDLLPPCLEMIGKVWYKGTEIKQIHSQNNNNGNPWVAYAEQYVTDLRESKTKRAYIAAKTATGKSTMFIAALWAARNRVNIRKIWLVEPRRVLRDETTIPFGIPSQILKKGIKASQTTQVYILTYGHLQSRLYDIDPVNDIVLFDEFHEEQGEMILGLHTVKAPIFLLSATPVHVSALKGSPYLAPNIDRRHPITVCKVPDGMPVSDMYLEAKNRWPDLMDRALVIVPTQREVAKTVQSLIYLGAGQVSPLSARDRTVPRTGVIVATPYVQTGLDIKPPPKILIDCGKDVVLDKGRFVNPLPWTNPDINQQRIGRVGRLQPGVVLQPESAGTGVKAKNYPSPNLFMHKVVADHFGMPQLTTLRAPVMADLPFMRLNTDRLSSLQSQKSVAFIHCLSLQGIRQNMWRDFHTRKLHQNKLGEDYEWIDRIMDNPKWSHVGLLDWSTSLYYLNMEHVVQYSISNNEKWCLPLSAVNGRWEELERTPTERLETKVISQVEIDGKHMSMQKQIDKIKSCMLQQASQLSEEQFQRTTAILSF